jgi:hypothetical protein
MLAVAIIFLATSVAWIFLSGSIANRTNESRDNLRNGVVSTWGAPQVQKPPVVLRTGTLVPAKIEPSRSQIDVGLDIDYRQKGLLWYSTYRVDFSGSYVYRNDSPVPQSVDIRMNFPAEHAVYDGFTMQLNGRAVPFASDQTGASITADLAPGESASLRVAYRSRGMDNWMYRFGDGVTRTNDFTLRMKTNFRNVDFPADSLSPTSKQENADGWDLTWRYENLISGFRIGMTMPEKLQPGPLAGAIIQFAPVSLLLFFFMVFPVTTLRKIEIHPMNYFFLACAFFSFHLLLAYLADHIDIQVAFVICSAVSVFLVVSYLRLVVGLRTALVEAGGAQLIYLVMFSWTFFLQGFTGLAITIGCILTLLAAMQLTGRIRWAELFAAREAR